jgi:hypothetical protein
MIREMMVIRRRIIIALNGNELLIRFYQFPFDLSHPCQSSDTRNKSKTMANETNRIMMIYLFERFRLIYSIEMSFGAVFEGKDGRWFRDSMGKRRSTDFQLLVSVNSELEVPLTFSLKSR